MNEITSDEMTENSIKRFEFQIKTLEKKIQK